MNVTTPLGEPYAQQIRNFILHTFPEVTSRSVHELIDAITEAIVATGSIRLGPRPSPEALVKIREHIRESVAGERAIRFLVPWGSEKPDGSSIDVAELAALKTLSSLRERIVRFYPHGAVFNLRLEDASAPHLFADRKEQAWKDAVRYTGDLDSLAKLLEVDWFIRMRPESRLVSPGQFAAKADELVEVMHNYLVAVYTASDPQRAQMSQLLGELGWKGQITRELVDHHLAQYAKRGETNVDINLWTLARYFSAAWARHQLMVRGDDPNWHGSFIDLSFVDSSPGQENYFDRRVYYRTLPSSITSNHLPPWRAKGYLMLREDGTVKPRLASFNDRLQTNPCAITLTDPSRGLKVDIQADYIVANNNAVVPAMTARTLL